MVNALAHGFGVYKSSMFRCMFAGTEQVEMFCFKLLTTIEAIGFVVSSKTPKAKASQSQVRFAIN